MIRESDIQWWVLEARKHPEAAPEIIQELAKRLLELDAENEELRSKIILLERRAPAPGPRSSIETLQRKVETLQRALQTQGPSQPSVVLISDGLQAATLPAARAHELADAQEAALEMRAALALQYVVWARPGDELLALTNLGRGFKRLQADLPPLGDKGRWPAPPGNVELDPGERVTVTTVTGTPPPRLWTVVTRRGYVQRLVRAGMDRDIAQGKPLLPRLDRHDEPAAIAPGDQGDLVIVTRWGQAIRFPHRTIETHGSSALQLDSDDQVVGALTLAQEEAAQECELLIVTASGYAIRRDSSQLPTRSQPGGKTRALIQARDVLVILRHDPRASQLLFATSGGKLVLSDAAKAAYHDRLAKGTQLCDLERDPAIAVAQIR
jgi:DNA gyrase/topoisomerase IV subunit A